MKRLLAFAPLAALAAVALAAIAVLMSGGEREIVSKDGLTGQVVPAYALAALGAEGEVTPAAFRGRAYVINVYASWCAPCLDEHPLLMELKARGAAIFGVAYKDAPADAARFLARNGSPYERVGLDPQGRYGLEIGVAGVPETFVIGADGRIKAVIRGPLTQEIVRTRIIPLLGLKP